MTLSHVSFTSVPVADFDRAIAFYRDRFGMELTVDAPMDTTRWVMLRIPGAATQLHLDWRAERIDRDGLPALALIAPDLDSVAARLQAEGIDIVRPPRTAEWNDTVRYAIIRDSEGNLVLLASA